MPAVDDTIGPYRLEREIGRGGMGVVFLSHDVQLDRPVAIKAMPAEVASAPERLARFEREARTLAQLNHPNVAGIYGVQEQDGSKYLVLEYVEGETLADRLDRGALSVDETLEIAEQIAAGVEAAHEAGVIHRDLKPANIKLAPDGTVKVLDFGLAKSATEETSGTSRVVDSPTLTSPVEHSPTIPGAIMGTAPYMSPEQARGRAVDKRSDIWSFGVVLYECLTGAGPFQGESAPDCIGAILHKEVDLGQLPPETPSAVRHVVRQCLVRDKRERLRDIGDARLELGRARRHIDDDWEPVSAVAGGRRQTLPWVLAALATIVAAAAGIALLQPDGAAPRRLVAEIVPPEGLLVSYRAGPIALSPDGRQLAFTATDGDKDVLCVRDLETAEQRQLAESSAIHSIFWSPDGESVAYIADLNLMTVDVKGGTPEVLTNRSVCPLPAGGSWGDDGTLLYASTYRMPLMGVGRMSRRSEVVIDPFDDRATDWPVWPSFLPDGDHFLFTLQDDLTSETGVYVGSLSSPDVKPILMGETNARYVDPPGALVFWLGGSLYMQRFDLERLELAGEPTRIVTDVKWSTWPAHAAFSVTSDRLAYLPAKTSEESQLVWYDRASGTSRELGVTGSLWSPRLSHDGRQVVLDRTTDQTAGDIAVLDLRRGTELLLTQDRSNESVPIWTPDDSEIYFFRGSEIYRVRANGTDRATLVYSSSGSKVPCDFTPDGKKLLFSESDPTNARSYLWLLDLATGQATKWLETPASTGRFSPDGRWVAHESPVAGTSQISVTNYPDADQRFGIGIGFGMQPLWREDGKEIVYRGRAELVSVEIDLEEQPEPLIGEPTVITDLDETIRTLDATKDLQRFLLIRVMQNEPGTAIRIMENWIP